jgi:hypothetical protein
MLISWRLKFQLGWNNKSNDEIVKIQNVILFKKKVTQKLIFAAQIRIEF